MNRNTTNQAMDPAITQTEYLSAASSETEFRERKGRRNNPSTVLFHRLICRIKDVANASCEEAIPGM